MWENSQYIIETLLYLPHCTILPYVKQLYIVLIQNVPIIEGLPVESKLTVLHNINYCVLKQDGNDFLQFTETLHA